MTEIDSSNGKLYINGQFFQSQIENELADCHSVGKNSYSKMAIRGEINYIPFTATGYYKNKMLSKIGLVIESEYIKERYRPPKDIDFRNYLNPYIKFCKNLTDQLVKHLMDSKKRKFEWGKVQIIEDPRVPMVFGEISYHGNPRF